MSVLVIVYSYLLKIWRFGFSYQVITIRHLRFWSTPVGIIAFGHTELWCGIFSCSFHRQMEMLTLKHVVHVCFVRNQKISLNNSVNKFSKITTCLVPKIRKTEATRCLSMGIHWPVKPWWVGSVFVIEWKIPSFVIAATSKLILTFVIQPEPSWHFGISS